jgi:hypothetical protein
MKKEIRGRSTTISKKIVMEIVIVGHQTTTWIRMRFSSSFQRSMAIKGI